MNDDQKENMKENIIAFLVIIVLIAGIWWWAQGPTDSGEQDQQRYEISVGISPSLGEADAPVTVIEFSDFECPYCARFALQEFPRITRDNIETGHVEFVYKYFPLQSHSHALLAAQAAACADEQDMFWEYHDALYENRHNLEVNQLLSYATDLGLNMSEFEPCLINEENKQDIVRTMQQGIDAGVSGTPTFFFNGRKVVGALSADEFNAEVQKELAEAEG